MAKIFLLLSTFAACSFLRSRAEAVEKVRTGEAFAVYIENDSRSIGGPGSDQAYSSGLKFSFIYAEDQVPQWSGLFPELQKANVNFGLSVGQQLYTPNNTQVKSLLEYYLLPLIGKIFAKSISGVLR